MKRLSTLIAIGLLLPTLVFALDISDQTSKYTDAPFSKKEAAGISVLTSLGAVSGNPDGSFAPRRTLNRAEFLKIVLLAKGDDSGVPANCFPDVRKADWFSAYVCRAKELGVVAGYPDGKFHPERSVNYAEALKMLVTLYDLTTEHRGDDQWYAPYLRAATLAETALPESVIPAAELTRGQMARLAAAFAANADGQLDEYRMAESGEWPASASSSSVSSSSSPVSSSSSTSSSVSSSSLSSSSSSSYAGFPVKSRFLLIGTTSLPIAGSTFSGGTNGVTVTSVEVKLRRTIDSIDSLFLVDATGKQIAEVKLDIFDSNKLQYKAVFDDATRFDIAANAQKVFGVVAKMKDRNQNTRSQELVEVTRFVLNGQDKVTSGPVTLTAPEPTFPQHQTAQATISSVVNAIAPQGTIASGTNKLIGSFTFGMTGTSPSRALVTAIDFTVDKSGPVAVTNWHLGRPDTSDSVNCVVSFGVVSCSGIPESLGKVDSPSQPQTINLYGDVTIDQGALNPTMQVSIHDAGTIGQNGSIRFSDEAGEFTWIDVALPVMGTLWK